MDADQITSTNPAWCAGLNKLTKRVCTDLGVNPDLVQCELDQLWLRQAGDGSKQHCNTDRRFATLVIQLPSRFTGGSVLVTHKGTTQTFFMQHADTSPYQCRYVAHYADCEHAIQPIESGHQLVLVYSLCFTGSSQDSKPSLANVQDGSFRSVMEKLDKSQSLFALPMDHRYSSVSLAQEGINALQGKDRWVARTIARVEGWQLLMAKIKGWDIHEKDQTEVCWEELFHQDGTKANAHQPWLDKELNVDSIQKGGNILADEQGAKEMWKLIDSTYHKQYRSCVLIAFSTATVFERVCRSDFSKACEELERNPARLDNALEFMTKSIPNIQSKDFVILHSFIQGKSLFWSSLKAMMQGLSKCKQVPSSNVISILALLIQEHGWNDEKMTPIRLFLEQLSDIDSEAGCMELLTLMEHFLTIKKVLQDDKAVMDTLMEKTIDNFAKGTGTTDSSLCYSDIAPRNRGEIYKRIESLSKTHGYMTISLAAKACLVRIKNMNRSEKLLAILADQIAAVESIYANVPDTKLDNTLEGFILDEFASLVKAERADRISFSKEFPTIHAFLKKRSSYWIHFNAIVKRMREESNLPCSSFASILVSRIQEHGWKNKKVAPVRLLIEKLPDKAKECDSCDFLMLMERLLPMKKTLEDKAPIDSLIQKTIRNFDKSEGTKDFMHRFGFQVSRKRIYEMLGDLAKSHGWESVSSTAKAIFIRIQRLNKKEASDEGGRQENKLVGTLGDQLEGLKSFHANIPHADCDKALEESILNAFADVVENHSADEITTSNQFQNIHMFFKNNSTYWISFKTLVDGMLTSESKHPHTRIVSVLASFLASTINEYGWKNEKVAPIHRLLERLAETGNKVKCMDLVEKIEVLLSIRKSLEDKSPIDSLIEKAARTFDAATGESRPSYTSDDSYDSDDSYGSFCSYSYRKKVFKPYFNENAKEIYKRLKALAKSHAWESISCAVKSCFARIRQFKRRMNFDCLIKQIRALESISKIVRGIEVDSLREPILKEFANVLSRKNAWWKDSDLESFLKDFVVYGTPEMFRDVERWASTDTSSNLAKLDSAFQKLTSTSINARNKKAVDKCIAHVHRCVCEQKIDELIREEQSLIRMTSNGPPEPRDWTRPFANTGHKGLDAFLQSDRAGSFEICVGGGKDNARNVVRNGTIISHAHAEENEVEVEASNKTGKNASVIVTKIEDTDVAEMEKWYQNNIRKLAEVRAKLEQLGHRKRPPAQKERPKKRAKVGRK